MNGGAAWGHACSQATHVVAHSKPAVALAGRLPAGGCWEKAKDAVHAARPKNPKSHVATRLGVRHARQVELVKNGSWHGVQHTTRSFHRRFKPAACDGAGVQCWTGRAAIRGRQGAPHCRRCAQRRARHPLPLQHASLGLVVLVPAHAVAALFICRERAARRATVKSAACGGKGTPPWQGPQCGGPTAYLCSAAGSRVLLRHRQP